MKKVGNENELQKAWNLIARHIVAKSGNPKNPHGICYFVNRKTCTTSLSFTVTMHDLEDDNKEVVLFESEKYDWDPFATKK